MIRWHRYSLGATGGLTARACTGSKLPVAPANQSLPVPIRLYGTRYRRAMTLLELLLALGLVTLVSAMMFMFYDTTLRARDRDAARITDRELCRVIAMRIAEEIRSANGFAAGVGPGVHGDDRVITIQTAAMVDKDRFLRQSIRDEPLPAQCDIRQVQYYLAYDEDESYVYPDGTDAWVPLGLVRREMKTLYQAPQLLREGQLAEVDLDLISPEMKYVRFLYFDGVDWVDKWDIAEDVAGQMGNSLPQAVEITVGYGELPPKEEEDMDFDEDDELIPAVPEAYDPRKYTVVVRLWQADAFLGSRLMRAQRRSSRSSSGDGG